MVYIVSSDDDFSQLSNDTYLLRSCVIENVSLSFPIFHSTAANHSVFSFLVDHQGVICTTLPGFKNILHLLLYQHDLFLDILISACTDTCKPYMLKFCLKTL